MGGKLGDWVDVFSASDSAIHGLQSIEIWHGENYLMV